jgi:hypothetical protein
VRDAMSYPSHIFIRTFLFGLPLLHFGRCWRHIFNVFVNVRGR